MTTVQTGTYPPQQNTVVVIQGNPRQQVQGLCPFCGIGVPNQEFTIAGLILALIFFPIGILCCLAMRESRCSHCRAAF